MSQIGLYFDTALLNMEKGQIDRLKFEFKRAGSRFRSNSGFNSVFFIGVGEDKFLEVIFSKNLNNV